MPLNEDKYQELKEKCPESCIMNAEGAFVPVELVDPRRIQEDELVTELIADADRLVAYQQKLKKKAIESIYAHLDLSTNGKVTEAVAREVSIPPLRSFDGRSEVRFKIEVMYRTNVKITELQALVMDAASEVDGGKKLVKAILSLVAGRTVNTKLLKQVDATKIFAGSESWKKAIAMLPDCMDKIDRRVYVRHYRIRDGKESMIDVSWPSIQV